MAEQRFWIQGSGGDGTNESPYKRGGYMVYGENYPLKTRPYPRFWMESVTGTKKVTGLRHWPEVVENVLEPTSFEMQLTLKAENAFAAATVPVKIVVILELKESYSGPVIGDPIRLYFWTWANDEQGGPAPEPEPEPEPGEKRHIIFCSDGRVYDVPESVRLEAELNNDVSGIRNAVNVMEWHSDLSMAEFKAKYFSQSAPTDPDWWKVTVPDRGGLQVALSFDNYLQGNYWAVIDRSVSIGATWINLWAWDQAIGSIPEYLEWMEDIIIYAKKRDLEIICKTTGEPSTITFMEHFYDYVFAWTIGNEPRLEPPDLSIENEAERVIQQCQAVRDEFPNAILTGPAWAGWESRDIRQACLDKGLMDIVNFESFDFYPGSISYTYDPLLNNERMWVSEWNVLPGTNESVFRWWLKRFQELGLPTVPIFLGNWTGDSGANAFALWDQDGNERGYQVQVLRELFGAEPPQSDDAAAIMRALVRTLGPENREGILTQKGMETFAEFYEQEKEK